MSYETLKLFRLFIPGILIFTFLAYLRDFLLPEFNIYIPSILVDNDGLKYALYLSIFALAGVLYDSLRIRKILLDKLQPAINANISSTLFNAVKNDIDVSKINQEAKGKETMRVFWYFIDKDPSLSEKSKAVRFNGLLWSTSMDAVIISSFSLLVFTIGLLGRHDISYIKLLLSSIIVVCLSIKTLSAVHKEHIKLSDEQLKIITRRHKVELLEKFKNEVL